MPLERVGRDQPLSKPEFHNRLRAWVQSGREAEVGPQGIDGRTNWVFVRDGDTLYALHADTSRSAVERYLEFVVQYGDDLNWEIVPSQRGKTTAVAYGPKPCRHTPFYLYAVGTDV
jgi:hypothetical protein